MSYISSTVGFWWSRVKKPPQRVSPVAEGFGVVCGPAGCSGPWCCKTWPGKWKTFRVGDWKPLFFYLNNAQKLSSMLFQTFLSWLLKNRDSTFVPRSLVIGKTRLITWSNRKQCSPGAMIVSSPVQRYRELKSSTRLKRMAWNTSEYTSEYIEYWTNTIPVKEV